MDYKQNHEEFLSGHEGGSFPEIIMITFFTVVNDLYVNLVVIWNNQIIFW